MVRELLSGNKVVSGGMSGVFIVSCPHPVWNDLDLVVWILEDGTVSLDALRPDQDVGTVVPNTPAERAARLREVLVGSRPSPDVEMIASTDLPAGLMVQVTQAGTIAILDGRDQVPAGVAGRYIRKGERFTIGLDGLLVPVEDAPGRPGG
jgi:hypothetical protein